MAKNNGTSKRVNRKRQGTTAPKTVRKPRLSEEAAAELAGSKVEEIAEVAPVVESVTDELEAHAIDDAPAVEEHAGADVEVEVDTPAPAPAPVMTAVVEEVEVLETAPPRVADAPEIRVAPAPPPPRAVSVWPAPPPANEAHANLEPTRADRRFRRIAFVRAMLHRLRREAEKRSAPIVRRVAARFPRLMALREQLRRWL